MRKLSLLLLCYFFCSCHQEEDMTVVADFTLRFKNEYRTAPLEVRVENITQNAHSYLWTFSGARPESSQDKSPGTILFSDPGEYQIMLEAWNEGSRVSKTETIQVDSAVIADFEVIVDINNYAPARFGIKNLSSGGISYNWSFEGGEPSAYAGGNPPMITYEKEGRYLITLEIDNGSQNFIVSKEIEVAPRLQAAFEIIPSFEDEDDMEAPLRATFNTRLKGVETLLWTCPEAEITNETEETASIYFQEEGEYTVFLDVSNGKISDRIPQHITVRKNTNLRTHQNICLGINTAGGNYPMYYSTGLRRVIRQEEVSNENAGLIDIIFFGLNADFTRSCFVSPADLSNTTFPEIPDARHTAFINKTETGSISISPGQFAEMSTDAQIRNLPIASGNTGDNYFSGDLLPRVVLFETSDRRKGAILVKEMVREGKENSYIIADIKVQKND